MLTAQIYVNYLVNRMNKGYPTNLMWIDSIWLKVHSVSNRKNMLHFVESKKYRLRISNLELL